MVVIITGVNRGVRTYWGLQGPFLEQAQQAWVVMDEVGIVKDDKQLAMRIAATEAREGMCVGRHGEFQTLVSIGNCGHCRGQMFSSSR